MYSNMVQGTQSYYGAQGFNWGNSAANYGVPRTGAYPVTDNNFLNVGPYYLPGTVEQFHIPISAQPQEPCYPPPTPFYTPQLRWSSGYSWPMARQSSPFTNPCPPQFNAGQANYTSYAGCYPPPQAPQPQPPVSFNYNNFFAACLPFFAARRPAPCPPAPVNNSCTTSFTPPKWVSAGGSVWGDPHFKDLTNPSTNPNVTNYDVMGESGKVYNILSDKSIQFNAEYQCYGTETNTTVSKVGIKLKPDNGTAWQVAFDAESGTPSIDGTALTNGQTKTLTMNGQAASVYFKDGTLWVKTPEYVLEIIDKGTHIDTLVKTTDKGVLCDLVNPNGLLGQTLDGDANLRVGNQGAGAQGQGAIDLDYQNYEVSGLFADPEAYINRFGVAPRIEVTQNKLAKLWDNLNNLLATQDANGNLVSVRRVQQQDGSYKLTLADGTTAITADGSLVVAA